MLGSDGQWAVPGRAVALAAGAGAAVTLVSVLPLTSVAYRSATLHVAIETAATLIALLAGLLLLGRFARAHARSDLVLSGALLLLGMTNLCFAVIPWIADEQPGSFDTWAPIAGRLLGAAGLAAGAVMSPSPVRRPRRAVTRLALCVAGLLAVIGLVAWALAPHLPAGVDPGLPPDPSGIELVGEPALLATQVLAVLLFAVAAAGFARRAARSGDELMAWLAAAATVAAFSRLNYFLFPSLYSEWVYAGDFLRLAFYGLVLAGALREIAAYQRELAEAAVLRERRRIARDLHDGLAQELAFIRSQAGRLRDGESEAVPFISEAAERALDEARHAIDMLARPVGEPLGASVAQAAEEVAIRDGVRLELDLEAGVDAPDEVHDAVTRIVREAVSNSIRHGHARSVSVRLDVDDGVRLTVEDDGSGLPGGEPEGRGFGLVSMRERAQALGGTLELTARRPHGVRLEVRLP